MKKYMLVNQVKKVKIVMFSILNFSKKKKKLLIKSIEQTKAFLKTKFIKDNSRVTFMIKIRSKAKTVTEKSKFILF